MGRAAKGAAAKEPKEATQEEFHLNRVDLTDQGALRRELQEHAQKVCAQSAARHLSCNFSGMAASI